MNHDQSRMVLDVEELARSRPPVCPLCHSPRVRMDPPWLHRDLDQVDVGVWCQAGPHLFVLTFRFSHGAATGEIVEPTGSPIGGHCVKCNREALVGEGDVSFTHFGLAVAPATCLVCRTRQERHHALWSYEQVDLPSTTSQHHSPRA